MKREVRIRTMSEEMSRTGLELPRIWPIRVVDHGVDGGTWTLPSLSYIGAIPTLWIVLHQIVDDWKREARGLSFAEYREQGVTRTEFQVWAFDELQPRFINCVFSYINFFFLLENGFDVMFDEIRRISKVLNVTVRRPRKPKRSEYLQRLRMVRNHTVVHWGGPRNRDDIDSRAGRLWGFSMATDADTLEEMAFGYASLVGARPRDLRTIGQTHAECTGYLRKWDSACASMLNQIVEALPLTVGTREYVHTDPRRVGRQ